MPSGHDAASEGTPLFFLSYAHRTGFEPDEEPRRNRLVKQFQSDLTEAVRQLSRGGHDVIATDAEPSTGDGWSEQVSRALARCGSFVALYSNEYFSSEFCGKEWGAFAERVDADRGLRGSRAQPIIPVLWQPVSEDALPACAREVRFQPSDLDPTYRRYGLNYLLRHLPEHGGEYEAVVQKLARRIIDVAEHEAPMRTERPVEYSALDDAFHRPGDSAAPLPRMKILIAALTTSSLPRDADPRMYGPRPTDWKPFIPDDDRTIADLSRRFAESMGFHGLVEAFERNAELGSGAEPSAPTLLIIDAWAVQDPSLRQQLSEFDRLADSKLWVRPMVLWNRRSPSNRLRAAELNARLTATLDRCRGRYRSAAPRVLDGLETVRDFINELPEVIREIERRYFAELSGPPAPAEESPRRPRFRGPGPALGRRGVPVQTFAERQGNADPSNPERRR